MSRMTTTITIRAHHNILKLNKDHGQTLIELCVCLAIVATLAVAAAPNMQRWHQRHHHDRHFLPLQNTLQFARQQAVLLNSSITVCPLNAQNRCYANWQGEISVFEDRNRNRQRDPDDTLLHHIPEAPHDSLRHYWRDAIVFDNKGFAGFTNGTLSHCVQQNNTYSATVITISRLGRMHIHREYQQNQPAKNSQGHDIPCN